MTSDRPDIWVLLGARAGDNAQARELARRVGGRVTEKQLHYSGWHRLPNVVLGASLTSVRSEVRTLLRAPWPDLVIGVGKRSVPVAKWIKAQSQGRTRIVQLGRPRDDLRSLDLVISTAQYGVPDAPNVVQMLLPLAVPEAVPPEVRRRWELAWQGFPRPWLVAAIGAQKYPIKLGQRELDEFGLALQREASARGASALLFASPRSAPGVISQVARHLTVPVWRSDGVSDAAYSYGSALAMGDAFAVTSDSVSMVSEMIAAGKPVLVHLLPRAAIAPRWQADRGVAHALAVRGVVQPPRDTQRFVQKLLEMELCGRLGIGGAFSSGTGFDPGHAQAVSRVRALLSDG